MIDLERKRERGARWAREHPESGLAWRAANMGKVRDARKKWKRNNPEKRRESKRQWKARRLADPSYRIGQAISTGLRDALNGKKNSKRAFDLVGYSIEHLKDHLESLFVVGMSWDNFGSAWHIDHIRPVASFSFVDNNDVRECWALTNLQPLFGPKNSQKGAVWQGVVWSNGEPVRHAGH